MHRHRHPRVGLVRFGIAVIGGVGFGHDAPFSLKVPVWAHCFEGTHTGGRAGCDTTGLATSGPHRRSRLRRPGREQSGGIILRKRLIASVLFWGALFCRGPNVLEYVNHKTRMSALAAQRILKSVI